MFWRQCHVVDVILCLCLTITPCQNRRLKKSNGNNEIFFNNEGLISSNFSNKPSNSFTRNPYTNMTFLSHDSLQSRIKRATDILPQKIDWRGKGVLTQVKDQKSCGACWAFSVLETVESMYAIKTGNLYDLSVQQLIDCSADGQKCNGGDTCLTLKWLVDDNVKILPEVKYPTTLLNEDCKKEFPKNGILVSSFECHDYQGKEFEMLELLANHGPLVVAVNSRVWHDYLGGIIQYHCDGEVDHAVQIVGYDLTGPVPYYIVRNSWGTSFGHDGYLYLKIGANICGIAQEVASITV